MSERELNKTYDPAVVEPKWSELWEERALSRAEAGSERPAFSMVIPPPNITGVLHLGHALNSTLQDILARYKRMKGFNVLWLPGIDHAGIATQNVVEREMASEGRTRHELGREEFVDKVWAWKQEYGGTIIKQLKRLGATCDWSRQRFTMDPGLSRAVREVFTRLYEDGLIYRGDYIINWCPRCATALSDLEVGFEETEGSLWYIEYPLKDPETGARSLTVATTRPETMLGDTAVAVNPLDERYAHLVGKTVVLPLAEREIPVIADETVSMEFGTGAVKVTPAHDFNDFELGRRHGLEFVKVMDLYGVMNENAGGFEGLDRFTARKKVVAELEREGLLAKTESHKLMLGDCYRCSTVVEPTLSKQWFVKTAPLAAPAIEAVERGDIRFVPRGWEKTYFEWMSNIRDWCISRQIWWGHRIPAWHCECGHVTVGTADPEVCAGCGSTEIEQDPDVLDTWFSSALWPFSTLGWPEKTAELAAFYPTSVLSTSFDIIFFWVARMIMMGLRFMDEVPFRDVYIHALIRDAEGRKMSKSKGNVIDPLVMMDEFGTDALRFTLAVLAAQGRDIKLSEERVVGYRNFCNKLWNLARFTLMNVPDAGPLPGRAVAPGNTADRWILTRLNVCRETVECALEGYRFDEAARALYMFVWHELCDWYVELIKRDLRGEAGEERKGTAAGVLLGVLKDVLKLLHPFMPFITDEIFSYLPGEKQDSLMLEDFPAPRGEYPDEAAAMESVMDVIKAVRNIRTEMNVPQGAEVECICLSDDAALRGVISSGAAYIKQLAKVAELVVEPTGEPPKDSLSARASGVEVFVPLAGLIDFEVELKRLEKELAGLDAERAGVEGKLSNEKFISRAPGEIVEKQRNRLASILEKRAKVCSGLERIKGMMG